jgi:hypothetical protein
MSYCTIADAKAITGVELPQVLLDEAMALIHEYTDYRWEETSITETISGDRGKWLYLKSPIISITSITIDGETLTEDDDYEIRHETGMVRIYMGCSYGHDNIVVVYSYGYTSSHNRYAQTIPLVKGAEARLALFLKRNPLLLTSSGVSGTTLPFGKDGIGKILMRVPKSPGFSIGAI